MSKLDVRTLAACFVGLLGVHCSGGSTNGAAAGTGGVDSSGGSSSATGGNDMGGSDGSGGNGESVCVRGDTRRCVGPGVCEGAQECNEARDGWTPCDCGDGTGGGTGGAAATGGNGTGASSSGGDNTGGAALTGGTTGSGGTSSGGAETGGTGGTVSSGGTVSTGGVATGGAGTGGSGTGGGSATGGTGGSASGGTGGGGSGGSATGGTGGGGSCENVSLDFVPQAPTVYVLVDQSGSIYDVNQWVPLRDALLPMFQSYQADVRFGFGSFTGTQAMCTGVNDTGSIGLDNYDAIAAHYNSLPTTPQLNQETPLTKALGQVTSILQADDDVPGERAIFLAVADDDSDYCDNQNPVCGNDSAIAAMQQTAALGIKTYVFAIDNVGIDHKDWLHFWAQAGVGQQPNWTTGLTYDQYTGQLWDPCNYVTGWKALWTSLGRTGKAPTALYSATGGTAQAALGTDADDIATAMSERIEGMTSCVFDLVSSNVEVQVDAKDTGTVLLNGQTVPSAQWRLNSTTQLELLGAACDTWKGGSVAQFSVAFPCDSLIK